MRFSSGVLLGGLLALGVAGPALAQGAGGQAGANKSVIAVEKPTPNVLIMPGEPESRRERFHKHSEANEKRGKRSGK